MTVSRHHHMEDANGEIMKLETRTPSVLSAAAAVSEREIFAPLHLGEPNL